MKLQQDEQLIKAYKQSLKTLNKNFFNDKKVGLVLFIEYLKYLRDISVIKTIDKESTKQEELATLVTAIAEFEAFYTLNNKTQRVFHWSNFCELMKQNMEEWLTLDDSV